MANIQDWYVVINPNRHDIKMEIASIQDWYVAYKRRWPIFRIGMWHTKGNSQYSGLVRGIQEKVANIQDWYVAHKKK